MVVTSDSLHEDADEHRHRKQDQLDDYDGRQTREPVRRLAHRKSIMDAVEVRVALAPEQFRRIESRDYIEKEESASLYRLQHEVGDWPDVLLGQVAGEVP